MRNRRILLFTNNEALVHIINKQTCRDKELMFFVHRLVLVCLSHNIVFKAKHIPGVRNKLANSLSRLQLQTFHQPAPAYMHPSPTEIPVRHYNLGTGETFYANEKTPDFRGFSKS